MPETHEVFYEARAAHDLERIESWIAHDSPHSSRRVVESIINSIDRLATFPDFGRSGIVPGTRQLTVGGLPYVVVYRVDTERKAIVIIAIFHAAQDRSETSSS